MYFRFTDNYKGLKMSNERERLGSRLGFILLSAGCAIGCGNVWKFPWMTGQYGGGAFVLVYLIWLYIRFFVFFMKIKEGDFTLFRNLKIKFIALSIKGIS